MLSNFVTFNFICFGPTRFLLSDKKIDTTLFTSWFVRVIQFRTLRYFKYAESNSSMNEA